MNRIRSIRALRCATALAAVLACGVGTAGAARAADLTYVFNVRTEPLSQALQELALQTGRTILFDERDVHGLMAQPVAGRYSVEQALDRLIHASGLEYSITDRNVIVVQHRQSAEASGPKLVRVATESAPAEAQASAAPTSSTLQEVVVTANRRAESAQVVPIAAAVVSAANIRAMGATDITSLTGKVPTLSIDSTGSTLYFLRGVGTTGTSINVEQSVASYIDGVYLYSTWAAEVPLSSVDRVEVLKGPQGTLFGRNTTGGVIQTITRDPMKGGPTLEASVGYDNYDTFTGTLYAANRLTDKLGVSLAVDYTNQGEGYGTNLVSGQKELYSSSSSAQLKAVYQPTTDTKFTGLFWYVDHSDSGSAFRLAPGYVGIGGVGPLPGFYDFESNTPDKITYHSYLGYLRGDQNLGWANLVAITSFRKVATTQYLDQDQVPSTYVAVKSAVPLQNFAQEIQLLSPQGSKITWLLGLYYFNAQAGDNPITIDGAAYAALGGQLQEYRNMKTRSLSGYGQATAEVLPDTRLTVGLRYTDETETLLSGSTVSPISVSPFFGGKVDSSGLTGRVSLDHRFNRQLMGYVSYNRGLKSGGFTLVTTANIPPYKPEHLDAYEIGMKSEWFDHRLRLNAAAYYYSFDNIQVAHVTTGGIQVGNAASAEIKGVDVDFDADLTRRLSLTGSVSWLDGKYTNFPNAVGYRPAAVASSTYNFDASGQTTVYSPPWSATLGATYKVPTEVGDFRLDGFLDYVDVQYVGPDNTLKIPSHIVANSSLAWIAPNRHVTVSIWAKNLFDLEYYANVSESTLGDDVMPAPPRTFGATVSYKY